MTELGITQSLEMFKDAGLVVSRSLQSMAYGQEEHFADFLSPRWMELFVHTLEEAQRLGLGLILPMHPAGLSGSWVEEAGACKTSFCPNLTLGSGNALPKSGTHPAARCTHAREVVVLDRPVKQPVTANETSKNVRDQIRYPFP